MIPSKEYSLKELAELVGASVDGDENLKISGLATLQSAGAQHLSFLANPAYTRYLTDTSAGAVILSEKDAAQYSGTKLLHANPYLAYAKLSQLWSRFALEGCAENQIHPSAVIAEDVELGDGVVVGAGCVIESGVSIGAGTRLGPNCTVGRDSVIGDKTLLHASVTIYHGIQIGANCVLHSGVVIGSDGFGFAPGEQGWQKIEQLGGVVIEDKVEIGANTTVDRGALDNTVIGKGVILDNQIQVAHNVVIGENTAIAACSAIAGSTMIGKNCIIGGASGIAGHLTVTDNVHITAMTMVIKSLTEPGVYSSGTGVQTNEKWRKSIARLRQLDKMAARLKALEKRINNS